MATNKRRETLLREAGDLPEHLFQEVLDFVRFLKSEVAQQRMETAILSETILAKDWLKETEDEAWQDL